MNPITNLNVKLVLSIVFSIALIFIFKGPIAIAALPQNPTWWTPQTATSCDYTNYYNHSLGKNWGGGTNTTKVQPYTLSSTNYNGLYTCGPRPNYDNNAPLADPQVQFFSGAVKEGDFECTELVTRYLWLQYGVTPYQAVGSQIVSFYNTSYGGNLSVINNGTSGQAPQIGDVISFGPTSTFGHAALVYNSQVDGNGNGSITLLQQNTTNPTQNLNVTNWNVAAIASGLNATGWLHKGVTQTSNISVTSTPTVNTNPVQIGQPFSAVFTVSNTGDLPFNLNQLILSVRDPNGVTHQVVGDNNATPLAGHSSRTFSPYNNITSFGDSSWPSGQYSIDPQYMDTNNTFQDISNGYPQTFSINPAQLSVTNAINITTSPVTLHSPFSGSFTVTNTGGVAYNLNELDLWAAGPNGSTYDIYGDGNSTTLNAGQQRTLSVNATQVPSFGSGCTTCTAGNYVFWGRVFTNGNPSGITNTNNIYVNNAIAPETGSQAMIGDDTYVDTSSVGTDNNIYRNAHSATTQTGWMGYGALSSGIHFIGKPSYAQTGQGSLSIIGRDNNGIVYQIIETSINPANWSSWSAFTAGSFHAAGDILQTMQPNQVFALFGVGTDGNIWWNELNTPSWNALSTKPSGITFTGKPSEQIDINGMMEIYARDTNGNLWQNHEDTSTTWHGWAELNQIGSGGTLTLVDDPVAMLHSNGLISVYGIGSDGNLYVAGQGLSGGNLVWYNWGELPVNIGVTLTGDLTTILDPNNVMEVVTKDTNGNIWDIYQANTSSYWSNWTKYSNSGFVAKGDPFMVQHLDNTEEIFCLGTDNTMWHMWSSGSGGSAIWSNWYSLGGSLTQ